MKHVSGKIKEKYEILSVIGEGAYGVVLKARKKNSNTIVAIKHFKQAPGYYTDIDVIERELNILQSLRFENVVELIEWFRDKKQCFLVFEYVEWNMLQVLQEHPEGLHLEQVRQLSYQLFSAIHWCHTHEIIHRDIKPENLLISKNFILKLCDFGFARFCNTHASADYYTDYVATRWYRSPELLIGSAYGKPVDVWACGCIMAELATGQALFAGESDIDQLYRIQKCLGPLPGRYMEAMRINSKFEGLKFPPIHHLDTLERRFGHLFPPDIMHLFKGTLRLYATNRLTAEGCIQHEAFVYLNQKRFQRQQQRPKTVFGTVSTSQSQINHNHELAQFDIPFVDSRLSRWYDENGEVQIRHRSPPLNIDTSMNSSFSNTQQPMKHRNNTQTTDDYQSKLHLSLNNEQIQVLQQPVILTPRSINDDDDNSASILSHHNRLRKKHISHQPAESPTMRYASNGVLLRSKQQHSTSVIQTSSKDKRFSLDQHQILSNNQQTPEPNIYRSSMAIAPNYNPNVYNIQINNKREEPNIEVQRLQTRDAARSRTVDCHPPVETIPVPPRTSSRQTMIKRHQMTSDDTDSMVSTTYSPDRSIEQQHANKYPWNSEQRRPVYGSDSHLMNSNEHNSSFSRPFYSPTKSDYAHANKIVMGPQRDSSHDPIKSAKLSSKQNAATYQKTPNESNRKQQSSTSSLGVYPYARTAILHVANAIIPSFHQRQQSIRLPKSKSRHHDV